MLASVASLQAADLPVYKAAVKATAIEYGNLYFGVDATSHRSLVGYTGVLYAPYGMHQSGLRVSAFGLYGGYEYHSDPLLIKGRFSSVDLLAGYSWVFHNGAFTLQVGGNYQDHHLRPNDPSNTVVGSELGFKVQGDIWMNPTPNTLLFALGSYSTAFDTYYSVGRAGYDFFGHGVFIGPEVGALGNDRTDQIRVGAHLSGVRIGPARVSLSGGWMHERGEGDGGYGSLNVDFAF